MKKGTEIDTHAWLQGLNSRDFPDAIRVVSLAGHQKGRRLADLRLHKDDLSFALNCLKLVESPHSEPSIVRESLWRSAVTHFIKCFRGNRSRGSLIAHRIYGRDASALRQFKFFESLRNKHLVHDENAYSQSVAVAVVNRKGAASKIARVTCLRFAGDTLNPTTYGNLTRLSAKAMDWVVAEYDAVRQGLAADFESKPYDELSAMGEPSIPFPGAHDDVHKPRAR